MMNSIGEKWFAVVNPHAGSGKAGLEWERVEKLLRAHGIDCITSGTGCSRHATEIACRAAEEGYRRFLAAGGDGTVHEVLCGIAGAIGNASLRGESMSLREFTLAVMPIGSGNDWIRSHGIRHDPDEVIRLLEKESFALQDIAKVTVLEPSGKVSGTLIPGPYSYMVNIGGAGLDARVCERVNWQKSRGGKGRMLYVKSLIYNLIHRRVSDVRIECDGKVAYEGKCMSVAFGVGRYSGGGLRQTPDAVTDDGLLDYTVVPPVSLADIFRVGPRLFNGTFTRSGIIISGRCRSLTVFPLDGDGDIVEVDGEIIGTLPVKVEILPSQINVLHDYGSTHSARIDID